MSTSQDCTHNHVSNRKQLDLCCDKNKNQSTNLSFFFLAINVLVKKCFLSKIKLRFPDN